MATPIVTKVYPTELAFPYGGIEIFGQNLLTSDLTGDFSNGALYTPIIVNEGYVYPLPDGTMEVGYTSVPGSSAKVELTNTVGLAYDFAVSFQYGAGGLTGVNRAILLELKTEEIADPNNYFSIALVFDKNQFVLEMSYHQTGSVSQNKIRGVNPFNLFAFRLLRTEIGFTAYVQAKSSVTQEIGWVTVFSSSNFKLDEAKLSLSVRNNSTPPNSPYSIILKYRYYKYVVSVMSFPAEVNIYNSVYINAVAPLKPTASSKLVLGFPDSTYLDTGFTITASGLSRYTSFETLFDVSINIFTYYSQSEEFDKGDGFNWENDFFVSKEKKNKQLVIPTIWDPYTNKLKLETWKSGYVEGEDLAFKSFKIVRREDNEYWYPKVRRGGYFLRDVAYYYHSDDSVTRLLGPDDIRYYYDGDEGRSYVEMPFLPKIGAPISVSRQYYNPADGSVIDKYRFRKVAKFKGIIQEGTELDTDANPAYIDKSVQEFKTIIDENYLVLNWTIPLIDGAAVPNADGFYFFKPPEIPLNGGYLDFSRDDIFKTRKTFGEYYGTKKYGEFYYGQKLDAVGDYGVNPIDGTIAVYLGETYYDLGTVSYAYKNPMIFDFNDNYADSVGTDVAQPTSQDLSQFDYIGDSTGEPSQTFNLREFPVFKMSTRIFIYDLDTNIVDSTWFVVDSFEGLLPNQKAFKVNPGSGVIEFGDGVNGAIPPKGDRIYGAYTVGVRIEYEPRDGFDYRIENRIDLNKNKYSIPYGFFSISRQNAVPTKIVLTSSKVNATTDDFIRLKVVVTDRYGNLMQGVTVTFYSTDEIGYFSNKLSSTNIRGEADTYFVSSSSLDYLGISSYFYAPSFNATSPGTPNPNILTDFAGILNSRLIVDQLVSNVPQDVFMFEIFSRPEEIFLPFDYEALRGGLKTVSTVLDINNSTIIRVPTQIDTGSSGSSALIFSSSLPSPFSGPIIKPDLVGFAVIGSKETIFYATVESGKTVLTSNRVYTYISYTDRQKHVWTVSPVVTPPVHIPYGTEISRATYLNPY